MDDYPARPGISGFRQRKNRKGDRPKPLPMLTEESKVKTRFMED
jgi:hypothetical protein